MGAITDRSQEHLGTADAMVIATRRKLIQAARQLAEQGVMPPASKNPALYRVRSCSTVLPSGVDWRKALADWHFARTTSLPAEAVATIALG
jgi:hypothetical protein